MCVCWILTRPCIPQIYPLRYNLAPTSSCIMLPEILMNGNGGDIRTSGSHIHVPDASECMAYDQVRQVTFRLHGETPCLGYASAQKHTYRRIFQPCSRFS